MEKAVTSGQPVSVEALVSLADELERADDWSPSFRHRVYEALGLNFFFTYDDPTVSLDTAAKLVPEGMVWLLTNRGMKGIPELAKNRSSAIVSHPSGRGGDSASAEGATPALALTTAVIRAVAGKGTDAANARRGWQPREAATNPGTSSKA